ncbi:hypothetical protein FACS1894178_9190 [Bacteroidia bacterium]|nr:hypothetical protein FACS1894178_9190 [Bacteroidia bacterium]
MKKIIACVMTVVMIVTTSQVKAQDYKHEFNLGYGYYTSSQLFSGLAMAMVTIGSIGQIQMRNPHFYGSFGLSYAYHFNNVVAIRPVFRADISTYEVWRTNNGSYQDIQSVGLLHYTSLGAGLEMEIDYINREWVKLYGYLGVIATFNLTGYKANEYGQTTGATSGTGFFPFFNAHITPIGVAFGKKFGGFAELGVGYNGLVRAGLYYKF